MPVESEIISITIGAFSAAIHHQNSFCLEKFSSRLFRQFGRSITDTFCKLSPQIDA